MSKIKEALTRVVATVSAECEVEQSHIMGRYSHAEAVDARWICVKILHEHGFYPSRIAEMMGITPRYVQYILTDFDDRRATCTLLRTNYERTWKKLRSHDEIDSYMADR